jgi:GAF domain-containing protein
MSLPSRLRRVHDANRVRSLESYRVVGTGREEVFDRIAREAAVACDTPLAFLTFLDDRRQWIKASYGSSLAETTLDKAVCAAAIEDDGLFVVPDCAVDPRVNWCPAVFGDPPVAFYAGAPLLDPDGQPLGTLCVVDTVPRKTGLTESQGEALESLSAATMAILNERRDTGDTTR